MEAGLENKGNSCLLDILLISFFFLILKIQVCYRSLYMFWLIMGLKLSTRCESVSGFETEKKPQARFRFNGLSHSL